MVLRKRPEDYNWQMTSVRLRLEDKALLDRAVKVSGESQSTLIERGIVAEAKRVLALHDQRWPVSGYGLGGLVEQVETTLQRLEDRLGQKGVSEDEQVKLEEARRRWSQVLAALFSGLEQETA